MPQKHPKTSIRHRTNKRGDVGPEAVFANDSDVSFIPTRTIGDPHAPEGLIPDCETLCVNDVRSGAR